MSRNSWPYIFLMLILSTTALAVSQTEQDDAYYRADETNRFNLDQERLNDQGYIEDALEPEVISAPDRTPLKEEASDCTKQGAAEECKKIRITN